jgi:hypothetical protein
VKKELKRQRVAEKFEPDLPLLMKKREDGSIEFSQDERPSVEAWRWELNKISLLLDSCHVEHNKSIENEIEDRFNRSICSGMIESVKNIRGYEYLTGYAEGLATMVCWLERLVTGHKYVGFPRLESVKEFREYIKTQDEAIKAERDSLRNKVPRGKRLDKTTKQIYDAFIELIRKKGLSPKQAVDEYGRLHKWDARKKKKWYEKFRAWWRRESVGV